ncbi:hypothetical protein DSO57_1020115 [Entomophthora muscae]|uniref:Uncharacterized protein n=1 Tax=Entomophthora muscae TaxID=34485 RepID=A0ACC2ST92_9FUNG|nr:hypothetical protein DSO57_1020115 [Entomophthora muscae]
MTRFFTLIITGLFFSTADAKTPRSTSRYTSPSQSKPARLQKPAYFPQATIPFIAEPAKKQTSPTGDIPSNLESSNFFNLF